LNQVSTRRGKPHLEAFPSVDILNAERSVRAGSRLCEWRDEHDQLVGQGRLLALDSSRMVFEYEFCGSANIERATGVLTVSLSGTRRNPNVVRSNIDCPNCQRRVQAVFFVAGSWACKGCHNLVYLKQRLASVNKKIHTRDEVREELKRLPEHQRSTRWFYNHQRHLERLERQLAEGSAKSLPQELLYRTIVRWLSAGEGAEPLAANPPAGGGIAGRERGLAYFRKAPAIAEPIIVCAMPWSKILHRPLQPFLSQHKAMHFAKLEAEILAGKVSLPRRTEGAIAALLAERIVLLPLVLTSDWSEVVESLNADGQAECSMTASYTGDRTLWPIGPGTAEAKHPMRAILDAGVVTLRVRLPRCGASDPQADLRAAAAKVEARLEQVEAKLAEFNATRLASAKRRVRYDLTHNTRPDRRGRVLRLK